MRLSETSNQQPQSSTNRELILVTRPESAKLPNSSYSNKNGYVSTSNRDSPTFLEKQMSVSETSEKEPQSSANTKLIANEALKMVVDKLIIQNDLQKDKIHELNLRLIMMQNKQY